MGSLFKNGINYSQGDTFNGVPIGTISSYISNVIPPGWLLLDGSIYNKTDFIELYYRIPENWKIGNDKFQLPDLRDKFVQGANGNLGSTIEAGLPNITGDVTFRRGLPETLDYTGGALKHEYVSSDWNQIAGNAAPTKASKISINAQDSNDIYGKSNTVQPPAITFNYIIKATNFIEFTNDKLLDDERMTNANVLSAMKILSMVDSVFETGENENGSWLKLKNGLIIQWGTVSKGSDLVKNAGWDLNVTLPISYSNKNFVFMVTAGTDSTTGTASGEEITTRNDDVNKVFVGWWNRNASSTAILPKLNWFAIGK